MAENEATEPFAIGQIVEGDDAIRACYRCEHRGEIPGSAHSRCVPFAEAVEKDDPVASVVGLMGRMPPLRITANGHLVAEMNEQGIKGGWAGWPFNFDPTWLVRCIAFAPKKGEATRAR